MKFKLGKLKKSEPRADNKADESYFRKQSDEERQEFLSGEIKYRCPMGCEDDKTYDSSGNCPSCNMKLVPVRKLKNEPLANRIVK